VLDKTCGVDVHEDLLVAGIVDDTAVKEAEFEYSLEGIESMKAWL